MNSYSFNTETQSEIEVKESIEKYKTTTVFGTGSDEDYSLDSYLKNFIWENPTLKTSTKETTFIINQEEDTENTYKEETNDMTDDYDINFKPKFKKIKMKVKIKSVRSYKPKIIL